MNDAIVDGIVKYRRTLCGLLCVEVCHRSITLELERRALDPESLESKIIEARMDELRRLAPIFYARLGKPIFPDGSSDEA